MRTGKKYKLTDETIQVSGHTLHRIEALKDFGNVKKGDKGGFIEKENILSQDGDCWVYNNAKVWGNARVYGNAKICGDALVSDNAVVEENAKVFGNANIYRNARVWGNAKVYSNASIYGNADVGITEKPVPSALDVYRGNTELEITFVNETPIDTVVVFKRGNAIDTTKLLN